MTDDRNGRPGPGGPDEIDTGTPVPELRDLEEEVSPSFVDRLRRRIERKKLTSQVAAASWHLPLVLMLEFFRMLAHLLGAPPDDKQGGSRDGQTD